MGLKAAFRSGRGMPLPGGRSLLATMSGAIVHMPVPRSETSTIEGSPVRSRWKSAAEIPPAIVIAPIESPKAARWMVGLSASRAVSPSATPPRNQ